MSYAVTAMIHILEQTGWSNSVGTDQTTPQGQGAVLIGSALCQSTSISDITPDS